MPNTFDTFFEDEPKCFKLILPAREIEPGRTVTKRTGTKQYVLQDKITVYKQKGEGEPMVIKADDGCAFLIDGKGNANVISGDTEVVWLATLYDIEMLLEGTPQ